MNNKLRVLVVDDSAFFRNRLIGLLNQADDIEVVGSAGDGAQALREVQRLRPNVVTMDVEMPIMDGITAVRQIMAIAPTPILMLSAQTHAGATATLSALDAGAVDFLPKNFIEFGVNQGQTEAARALRNRVFAVGRSCFRNLDNKISQAQTTSAHAPLFDKPADRHSIATGSEKTELVVIGASTGGPVALQAILRSLPADFPIPIVIVVHMPASFTPAFAARLDSLCKININEAQDGMPLRPGQGLIAPGGKQLVFAERNENTIVRITESATRQTYKPSVDITLGSAARLFPGKVLAIVLTGMGADGKQGAQLLKEGGSTVWSQDEQSCVVYGMPQAVEKAGLSDKVLPLTHIGRMLTTAVQRSWIHSV